MASGWVLIALGAVCILAAIVFVYRGAGGTEGGATIKGFGVEISVQKAGQAGITLVIGAALVVWGARLIGAPSKISVISYVRDGTNHHGEFRKSGSVWLETFEADLQHTRYWTEVAHAGGRLRLASLGAIVEIDPATMAIDYSDDGKTAPRRLDTITSITRE